MKDQLSKQLQQYAKMQAQDEADIERLKKDTEVFRASYAKQIEDISVKIEKQMKESSDSLESFLQSYQKIENNRKEEEIKTVNRLGEDFTNFQMKEAFKKYVNNLPKFEVRIVFIRMQKKRVMQLATDDEQLR